MRWSVGVGPLLYVASLITYVNMEASVDIPVGLYYSESHEWVRQEEDGIVTIGVTDHAQNSLGEVVYVELPEIDDEFSINDEFGVVESVKAASDLIIPLSGTVVAVNEDVMGGSSDLVNSAPYGEGWLIKLKLEDESELESLFDAAGYEDYLNSVDE